MILHEILKRGFFVLIFRASGALLTFLSLLIIARSHGPDGYGLFTLGLTVITILSVFVRFGLDNVILKNVSSLDTVNPLMSEAFFLSAMKLVVILSLLTTFIIYINADFISIYLFSKKNFTNVLQMFSFLILPFSLVYILSEYYKAKAKPEFSSFCQNFLPPALFVCVCSYLLIFNYQISLEQSILFWELGFVVSFFCFIFYKDRQSRLELIPKIKFLRLIEQGLPMIFVSSGALILAWSDIIILGILGSAEELGVYSAASRTVLVTTLLLSAMNALTAPRFAMFYSEKRYQELKNLAKLATKVLTVLVLIPTFLLLLFPLQIMNLFGEDFEGGSLLLVILSIGQFFNVSCGSVGYLLTMTGMEKKLSQIMLSTALLNLFMSIALYYLYGFLGVAVATAASVIMWNLWAVYEVKKHLGFFTFPTFTQRF